MAIIYLATNKINGKRYIGVSTRQTMRLRIYQHKSDAICRHRKSRFHDAIRKYGFENFEWMEIFQCDDPREALAMEIFLISSERPEYNISAGGEGRTAPLSESAKKKLIGNKNAIGNKSRLGGCNSAEARKKISDNHKASAYIKRQPVICLDTGVVYVSLAEAGEKLGMDWSGIWKVCAGKRKKNNGLKFAFWVGPEDGRVSV